MFGFYLSFRISIGTTTYSRQYTCYRKLDGLDLIINTDIGFHSMDLCFRKRNYSTFQRRTVLEFVFVTLSLNFDSSNIEKYAKYTIGRSSCRLLDYRIRDSKAIPHHGLVKSTCFCVVIVIMHNNHYR